MSGRLYVPPPKWWVVQERARRIVHEVEQIRADADRWNQLHPDEDPLDHDPDGDLEVILALANRILKKVRPAEGAPC